MHHAKAAEAYRSNEHRMRHGVEAGVSASTQSVLLVALRSFSRLRSFGACFLVSYLPLASSVFALFCCRPAAVILCAT